jgi:hypothetical protein
MAYEQKPNTGTLFINDKKGNEKAPDRKGTVNIGGVTYQVAGWIKEGKKGPFLSLSFQLPKERDEPSRDVNQGGGNVGAMPEDEIPFITNKGV